MEKDPTLWDKRKESRDLYQKGVKEGFNQGMWAAIAIAICAYFLISILPS